MNHLFPWSTSQYTKDLLELYKEKEKTRPRIRLQSPQLKKRGELVHIIKTTGEKFKLAFLTVHLAVYLLDRFMDNHNIVEQRLKPIALLCLIVAAKIEENAANIPKLRVIARLCPAFTISDLAELERFILKSFQWRICWPTAAHFTEFYMMVGVIAGDSDPNDTPHRGLRHLVSSSLKRYLDLSLDDIKFMNLPPSEIAAACLLLARLEWSVRPLWPPVIATITSNKFISLHRALQALIEEEMCKKLTLAEDDSSGYWSSYSPQGEVPVKRAQLTWP